MKHAISIILVIFSLATYSSANEAGLRLPICKEENSLECTQLRAEGCGLENIINGRIENLRGILQVGNPDKGIPSFDPFELDKKDLAPNSPLLSGTLNVTNLILQGVPEFVKTRGCYGPNGLLYMKLELGLRFDKLVLTTGYTGILNLFEMINLFGTGDASITVSGLSIDVIVDVRLPKVVEKVEVILVAPVVDIKLTGLLNDEYMSDIISRQLSDTLTTLAKEEEANINKMLNELIAGLIGNPSAPANQAPERNSFVDISEDDIVEAFVQAMQLIIAKEDTLINWLTKKYFN